LFTFFQHNHMMIGKLNWALAQLTTKMKTICLACGSLKVRMAGTQLCLACYTALWNETHVCNWSNYDRNSLMNEPGLKWATHQTTEKKRYELIHFATSYFQHVVQHSTNGIRSTFGSKQSTNLKLWQVHWNKWRTNW